MSFFEDKYGVLYPLSQIASIRRGKFNGDTGRENGKVYLTNGDEYCVEVTDGEIDRIIIKGQPVVQAQPGYTLLGYWSQPAGEEPFIDEHPIVAWRITDDTPMPIIVEFDFEGMRGVHGVLRPDGKIADLFGSIFDSRSDWLDHMRESDKGKTPAA